MRPKPVPAASLAPLAVALLALAITAGLTTHRAKAQAPRPIPRPANTPDIVRHLTTGRFERVYTVDSTGRGDFSTITAALAAAAALPSSKRNWTTRILILVYPGAGGSTDPDLGAGNYTAATYTIPDYVELAGFPTGHNNPVSLSMSAPILQMTGTAGSIIRLGSGSSLANLSIIWFGAPTADLTIIEHDGAEYLGEITNVAVAGVATSIAHRVDGITETRGGLYVYGGGVIIDGSPAGRAVVNNNNVNGSGISLYGGRYAASSGCAALFQNAAANGSMKLFEGLRIDAGCTADLLRSGTGTIEVFSGVNYGPATGSITNGITHSPYGTTLPPACSPGSTFVNTTTGTEKICFCTASNLWKCAAGS